MSRNADGVGSGTPGPKQQLHPIQPQKDVALSRYTTLALGGPAAFFYRAENVAALKSALAWATHRSLPVHVLGGGSNLVVPDAGVPGLVVQLGLLGVDWRTSEGEGNVYVTLAAGEPWDGFVAAAAARGLWGVECLSGIPGTVGATPIQNVGAYGQSVADTLCEVHLLDRQSGQETQWTGPDCEFRYRDSRFKHEPDRYIVLAVRFSLNRQPGPSPRYPELQSALVQPPAHPLAVRDAVLALRRAKSMVIDPDDPNRRSAGSFFVNPLIDDATRDAIGRKAVAAGWIDQLEALPCHPAGEATWKMPAAWLIEKSGHPRGSRRGAVGQSSRHALALVHHGGGTTSELLAYAAMLQEDVARCFGVLLSIEPTCW